MWKGRSVSFHPLLRMHFPGSIFATQEATDDSVLERECSSLTFVVFRKHIGDSDQRHPSFALAGIQVTITAGNVVACESGRFARGSDKEPVPGPNELGSG